MENVIYTIGHSNHPIEVFIEMLKFYQIRQLADVRLLPGSKLFPQFNHEALKATLLENNITYKHFKDLGGRRKPLKNSTNRGWRSLAFQGYADYMATKEFQEAIHQLENLGKHSALAFMCAEAVWWSCHRSLISDYLKLKGWKVMHIMAKGKSTEHPYTSPAKIVERKLTYPATADLFGE